MKARIQVSWQNDIVFIALYTKRVYSVSVQIKRTKVQAYKEAVAFITLFFPQDDTEESTATKARSKVGLYIVRHTSSLARVVVNVL